MKHVLLMPYAGWAACQLDRDFAGWLLRRVPHWRPNMAGVCPVCRAIVEESAA